MTPLIWLSAAFLSLAAGKALLPRQSNSTITSFGVIAIHSGSPIHLSSVNASGNLFWIGKQTATYCPAINGLVCPPGNNTAFDVTSGSDYLAMVGLTPR